MFNEGQRKTECMCTKMVYVGGGAYPENT